MGAALSAAAPEFCCAGGERDSAQGPLGDPTQPQLSSAGPPTGASFTAEPVLWAKCGSPPAAHHSNRCADCRPSVAFTELRPPVHAPSAPKRLPEARAVGPEAATAKRPRALSDALPTRPGRSAGSREPPTALTSATAATTLEASPVDAMSSSPSPVDLCARLVRLLREAQRSGSLRTALQQTSQCLFALRARMVLLLVRACRSGELRAELVRRLALESMGSAEAADERRRATETAATQIQAVNRGHAVREPCPARDVTSVARRSIASAGEPEPQAPAAKEAAAVARQKAAAGPPAEPMVQETLEHCAPEPQLEPPRQRAAAMTAALVDRTADPSIMPLELVLGLTTPPSVRAARPLCGPMAMAGRAQRSPSLAELCGEVSTSTARSISLVATAPRVSLDEPLEQPQREDEGTAQDVLEPSPSAREVEVDLPVPEAVPAARESVAALPAEALAEESTEQCAPGREAEASCEARACASRILGSSASKAEGRLERSRVVERVCSASESPEELKAPSASVDAAMAPQVSVAAPSEESVAEEARRQYVPELEAEPLQPTATAKPTPLGDRFADQSAPSGLAISLGTPPAMRSSLIGAPMPCGPMAMAGRAQRSPSLAELCGEVSTSTARSISLVATAPRVSLDEPLEQPRREDEGTAQDVLEPSPSAREVEVDLPVPEAVPAARESVSAGGSAKASVSAPERGAALEAAAARASAGGLGLQSPPAAEALLARHSSEEPLEGGPAALRAECLGSGLAPGTAPSIARGNSLEAFLDEPLQGKAEGGSQPAATPSTRAGGSPVGDLAGRPSLDEAAGALADGEGLSASSAQAAEVPRPRASLAEFLDEGMAASSAHSSAAPGDSTAADGEVPGPRGSLAEFLDEPVGARADGEGPAASSAQTAEAPGAETMDGGGSATGSAQAAEANGAEATGADGEVPRPRASLAEFQDELAGARANGDGPAASSAQAAAALGGDSTAADGDVPRPRAGLAEFLDEAVGARAVWETLRAKTTAADEGCGEAARASRATFADEPADQLGISAGLRGGLRLVATLGAQARRAKQNVDEKKAKDAAAAEEQSRAGRAARAAHFAGEGAEDLRPARRTRGRLVTAAAEARKTTMTMCQSGGSDLLTQAISDGNMELVRTLLEQGHDPDPEVADGSTSLLLFASSINEPDIVKLLAEYGADVDKADQNGVTPLLAAACSDAADAVQALCELGADVDRGDSEGWTALYAAGFCDCLDAVEELLDAGADVTLKAKEGMNPAEAAAQEGNQKVLCTLNEALEVQRADALRCSEAGETPSQERRQRCWRQHRQSKAQGQLKGAGTRLWTAVRVARAPSGSSVAEASRS
ncbi:unnamed protein product [Prorocentrum cordatum]|uniref:Uncharacterized protein n=1 Tax=Prorocentrum cordatum TaxID=2364126 RepID=A0ABN9U4W1_9DINO|nr:unnamed protein product [Polarella glacialis]